MGAPDPIRTLEGAALTLTDLEGAATPPQPWQLSPRRQPVPRAAHEAPSRGEHRHAESSAVD